MASPPQLREESAAIAALAVNELRQLVAGLPDDAVRETLLDLLPGVIASFAEAAAVAAAEWYDDHRASLGVRGAYQAFVPSLRDPGVESLLAWADGYARNELTKLKLIEGSTYRRVVNGSRAAIIENVDKDPQGKGYQRFARTTNAGCAFCRMLAGRGEVYRSAETASFASHDNCQCAAVPAFDGAPIPVRPYTPSAEHISDADRARVREWLRTH